MTSVGIMVIISLIFSQMVRGKGLKAVSPGQWYYASFG